MFNSIYIYIYKFIYSWYILLRVSKNMDFILAIGLVVLVCGALFFIIFSFIVQCFVGLIECIGNIVTLFSPSKTYFTIDIENVI